MCPANCVHTPGPEVPAWVLTSAQKKTPGNDESQGGKGLRRFPGAIGSTDDTDRSSVERRGRPTSLSANLPRGPQLRGTSQPMLDHPRGSSCAVCELLHTLVSRVDCGSHVSLKWAGEYVKLPTGSRRVDREEKKKSARRQRLRAVSVQTFSDFQSRGDRNVIDPLCPRRPR